MCRLGPLLLGLCGIFVGCVEARGEPSAAPEIDRPLTREELLDPESCAQCHPRHYREWKSSTHAYAAADPIFQAMNRRGQEETGGALGDFCVRCHAPMAVLEGKTRDGLNFDEVDDHLEGVTCYFCHTADHVARDDNHGLVLADGRGDRTMRGGIFEPVPVAAHGSAFSPLHSARDAESSRLCGACHDVTTPSGLSLERTYQEFLSSAFAASDQPLGCVGCHMRPRSGLSAASLPGVQLPERGVHEHLWPGVDLPLISWPDQAAYRAAVECELSRGTILNTLDVRANGELRVALKTTAGHSQPSGASHNRRLWVELVAYDKQGKVLLETGRVADDEIVDKLPSDPAYDPLLELFRGRLHAASGAQVAMLWEADASAQFPNGLSERVLPARPRGEPDLAVDLLFRIPSAAERVTVRARMRPIGLDVVDDLIASGHLASSVRARVPTYTLYGTAFEWRARAGYGAWAEADPSPLACPSDYRCLFEPEACP